MTDPKRPESLDLAIEQLECLLADTKLFTWLGRRRLDDAIDVLKDERERRKRDADRP